MDFNQEEFALCQLVITKEQIESFDHSMPLGVLAEMKNDARRFEGKVYLVINGYDDDPREVYEINAIREYFDFLDRSFPYWFFFLARKLTGQRSPFLPLLALLVPLKSAIGKGSGKLLNFDETALDKFLEIHFHYLNELTDELHMTLEENQRISEEVIKSLYG